jgi:hypothetical protein
LRSWTVVKGWLSPWRSWDRPLLVLVAAYLLMWAPLLTRSTANPQLLATFNNDEPTITYELVGMGMRPYGDPANLLRDPRRAPPEWRYLGYGNFMYYGGTYLDAAFLLYVPLHKWLGLPDFPVAPICLRCVTLAFGLLALVLVYLLARRIGGRLASVGAGLILLMDLSFASYSSMIHPDTTMLAVALAALWTAIRHAETGRLSSLLGVGFLAGVVHGTKMGGPWVVPMAVLAVVWGLKSDGWQHIRQWLGWERFLGRLVLLGAAAAAGFFVSTPYAFVDSYYFAKALETKAVFGNSPFEQANLGRWLMACWDYFGPPLAILHVLGFGAVAVQWLRGGRSRALMLTAVLGLSVIAWYTTMVRLWVCVPYLLTALAVMSILSAVLVSRATAVMQQYGPWGRRAGIALVTGCVVTVLYGQGLPVGTYLLREHLRDHSTYVLIGRWAATHLPHDSKILFDDCAYFDPTIFPNARLHGGLMTYKALQVQKPDFFVINETIYGANHYLQLRRTQKFMRSHEGSFSVLLYQDLLDRGGSPEAELVHVAQASDPDSNCLQILYHLVRATVHLEPSSYGSEIRLYRYRGPAAVASRRPGKGPAMP